MHCLRYGWETSAAAAAGGAAATAPVSGALRGAAMSARGTHTKMSWCDLSPALLG